MAGDFADTAIEESTDFTADNGNTVQNYLYEDGSGELYLEENADGSQYSRLLLIFQKTDDTSKLQLFMRSVLLYMSCSSDIYVDLGKLFYEASISSDGTAIVLEKSVCFFFSIEEDKISFLVESGPGTQ